MRSGIDYTYRLYTCLLLKLMNGRCVLSLSRQLGKKPGRGRIGPKTSCMLLRVLMRASALYAIVPQCAILEFKFLLKEFQLKKHPITTCYHKTGFIDNQNTCYKLCDPTRVTPDLGLVLKGNGLTIRKSRWPTPRARKTGSCAILTDRYSRDLGTALNFEITTAPGYTNPEWVEWLPKGWTDFLK